jgi:hypothetical protein
MLDVDLKQGKEDITGSPLDDASELEDDDGEGDGLLFLSTCLPSLNN